MASGAKLHTGFLGWIPGTKGAAIGDAMVAGAGQQVDYCANIDSLWEADDKSLLPVSAD